MKIHLAPEAHHVIEAMIGMVPVDYTIGVVIEGNAFCDESHIVEGQDFAFQSLANGWLVLRAIDPETLDSVGEDTVVDLSIVSEIHIY